MTKKKVGWGIPKWTDRLCGKRGRSLLYWAEMLALVLEVCKRLYMVHEMYLDQ